MSKLEKKNNENELMNTNLMWFSQHELRPQSRRRSRLKDLKENTREELKQNTNIKEFTKPVEFFPNTKTESI